MMLKPYPAYKDSSLPWLGEIPQHWQVVRIKNIFREMDERSGDGKGILLSLTRTRGLLPHTEATNRLASAEDLSKYKVCKPRQLVMNRMQAWSGMFAVASQEGLVSPDYSVFSTDDTVEVSYFEHLFKSPIYIDQFAQHSKGIGSGFNRLYTPDFGAIPLVLPPRQEQERIVRFLAHSGHLVNRLIRTKRRLIELLNEQKQAIIHQAVTRGLDPNVRLKSSGIDWHGGVPEHWDVSRLDRFITLQRGIDITKERQIEGPIPVVSSGGISSYHNQFTSRGPGVLVGRKGTVGSVHFVQSDHWAHDTTLWVKEFNGNHPKFVYYLLKKLDLKRFDTGSANPTLNRNIVHPERVAFPPADEQHAIASFLDQRLEETDKLIQHSSDQTDFLNEYRTRLIADVVTGKLDVRSVELPTIDEAETIEDWEIGEDTQIDEMDEMEGVDA